MSINLLFKTSLCLIPTVANCAVLQNSDSYLVEFFDFQAKHGKWYQTEEEVELRAGVF